MITEEEFNAFKEEQARKEAEMAAKLGATKEGLDQALEEIAKLHRTPAQPAPAAPVATPTPAPASKKDDDDPDEAELKKVLSEEVDKAMKDAFSKMGFTQQLEAVKSETQKFIMQGEKSKMVSELQTALAKYPDADRREILWQIEDGSTKSIEELAKDSNDRVSTLKSDLKTKIEGELKEQFKKEQAGGFSVPQSPGNPQTPANLNTQKPMTEDAMWAAALKESKASAERALGGGR